METWPILTKTENSKNCPYLNGLGMCCIENKPDNSYPRCAELGESRCPRSMRYAVHRGGPDLLAAAQAVVAAWSRGSTYIRKNHILNLRDALNKAVNP